MGRFALTPRVLGVLLVCLVLGSSFTSAQTPDMTWLERVERRVNPMLSDPAREVSGPHVAPASGGYPASGVNLLSRVPLSAFSSNSSSANDVWGYVSPSGREYGILGLRRGTGFVEVTDPYNPVVLADILDANSIWSDQAIVGEYCLNVNEGGGGMQVIDLRQIDNGVVTLLTTLTSSGLQTAHNVASNEETGYAYLCGANIAGGGLVAVNMANPASPVIAGAWTQAYVHDTQVVSYHTGPYAGREIAFNSCGYAGLRIVDVTSKSNMFTMSILHYPNRTYTHQGWLTEDRKYFLINDELDELQNPNVQHSTTYVINVENLSSPFFVTSYTTGLPVIDHNHMVRGNYIYHANYTSGLRIFDISDIMNAQPVGFFDTYLPNNSMTFDGAWGVYTGLPSGVVLVSDQTGGLFVLDPSPAVGDVCLPPSPPRPELNPIEKNRYISFRPPSSGDPSAISITLVDAPPPFDALIGESKWIELPQAVNDDGDIRHIAELSCSPVLSDWSMADTIHVTGDFIVPGAEYEIQAVEADCTVASLVNGSFPLTVQTSGKWGDVTGSTGGSPPNGVVDIIDIAALVSKFGGTPGALSLIKADLMPAVPDQVIDISDVSASVSAFQGLGYNAGMPTACP